MESSTENLAGSERLTGLLSGTRAICLDIETTGFNKNNDYIIELGLIEFVDGIEVSRNTRLFGGGSSPPGALACHGISDAARTGKDPIEKKASALSTYLSDAIIVGHNVAKFDVPFIATKLKTEGFNISGGRVDVIDTLLLARRHLAAPSNKLEDLCKVYGVTHGAHRGLGDSESCWNILGIIVDKIKCDDINSLMERVEL